MFRGKTIVAALVFCLATGSAAFAQDGWWHRHDNSPYGVWQQNPRHDHDADDGWYDRNGNWHERDRDHDRDRDRRNGGWYGNSQYGPYGRNGNYGNYALNQARQVGFNDGLMDGRNDAGTGHSYRPTQDSNYKHANRGWNGQIDRGTYRQAYRDAYLQGYQRGYGANGRYGYRYPQGYGWPR